MCTLGVCGDHFYSIHHTGLFSPRFLLPMELGPGLRNLVTFLSLFYWQMLQFWGSGWKTVFVILSFTKNGVDSLWSFWCSSPQDVLLLPVVGHAAVSVWLLFSLYSSFSCTSCFQGCLLGALHKLICYSIHSEALLLLQYFLYSIFIISNIFVPCIFLFFPVFFFMFVSVAYILISLFLLRIFLYQP